MNEHNMFMSDLLWYCIQSQASHSGSTDRRLLANHGTLAILYAFQTLHTQVKDITNDSLPAVIQNINLAQDFASISCKTFFVTIKWTHQCDTVSNFKVKINQNVFQRLSIVSILTLTSVRHLPDLSRLIQVLTNIYS